MRKSWRNTSKTTQRVWTSLARGLSCAGFLLLFSFSCPVAKAQLPASSSGSLSARITDASGAMLPAASQFNPTTNLQTDLILGQNSVGPYRLSWRNAQPGSDTVVVDGQLLQAGRDYTIDWPSGTIRFTVPLRVGQMARVTYSCNTPNAVRDVSERFLPLQWNFWQGENGFLRVSSLLRASNTLSGSQADPRPYTALQFQDRFHLLSGSDATTGLFLDMHGQDWLRRSGFLLNTSATLRGASFGLSYQRAGTLFAQQSVQGLSPGQQIFGFTGTLSPNQALALQLVARQADQLTVPRPTSLWDNVNCSDRLLSATLNAKLPQNGQLMVGHSLETVQNHQGGVATIHDMAVVTQPVAPNATAALRFDSQSSAPFAGSNSSPTYTQAAGIELSGSLTKQTQFATAFTNSLTPSGYSDDQKVSLSSAIPLSKSQQLKLSTLYEDIYASRGAQRNRSLLLQAPLQGMRAQLSGGVQYASTPATSALVGLLDITAQPLKSLQLTGTARFRDAQAIRGTTPLQKDNTYGVQVAYSPLTTLQLTGSLFYNPETNGLVQQVQTEDFGLQTRLGILSMRAQWGLLRNLVAPSRTDTANFGMDLYLTPWDTLTAGLQAQNLLGGPNSLRTYLIGFKHHFNSVFDLSLTGSVTYNGALSLSAPTYSAQAQIGLHF